ncbi:MAG TPA: DEAD/DEAH box helicase [Acidimicrobiia bacterium]
MSVDATELFSPATRAWFSTTFAELTPPQAEGWPVIDRGDHTLIVAPTGSGKTLAAFLAAIDRLTTEPVPPKLERCRVLYVSPLRALAVDIDKNLRAPLRGVELAAERLGDPCHVPVVGVRTGDTESKERAALLRTPPDILITTPESLYLMLTSRARDTLRSVRWVIIDEIHALAATKRGAHLALSLERLTAITTSPPQRIGLSATVRPLDEIARFLGGYHATAPGGASGTRAGVEHSARPVTIVDTGTRKELDLEVIVPVDDMANVEAAREDTGPGSGPPESAESRTSIWPHIHPLLLDLIREHTTTIVFTNARRLSERLAARLNELAGEELVRAHHGSLAREQRMQVEDDLKSGRLRGIIATSSLELGIDMGTVDLVVLVESPGSVARGLQRVGRAGHQVGAPSSGRIFPKWRGDLLETAAVVRRMRAGLVEEMRVVHQPLDVLAQHIVAACAVDSWDVDELRALVRRSANFVSLTDELFDNTLDLLAGRYPTDEFSGLQPRVVWDRIGGRVEARAGSQRVAVTNAGTIPDRGLFSVFMPDGKRVGELDEEMVYESRPGEVFALGATAWRIEEITHDRVVVTPAPGEHAKLPFWKGDKPGRPLELGRAVGAIVRELRSLDEPTAAARLHDDGFDNRAATNLLAYLEEQHEATGTVPDDRTIVVERFPDEIGDWRVCILTPFGARVHAPWAFAIEEQLARNGIDAPAMWSDDGIVLRLPEAVDRVPLESIMLDAESVEQLVVERLPSTSMFASRFRENAARALLLPRRDPRKRTPLWMQRQRAGDLLEVAARYPAFPMLLETTRECLRDVFDLPALREVLHDVQTRKVRVVEADTPRASPFAQSLLFGWIAVYMYEGDAPIAERRAAALALDRGLLRELLGSEDLRELLDPAAIADLELELQRLAPDRHARALDGVADLLRGIGDLRVDEVAARTDGDVAPWLERLVETRRAIRVRIAGEERFAAAEDAARLRDALGCALPPGLPAAFTDPVERPLDELVARYARTHGPFRVADIVARWAVDSERVRDALGRLATAGRVVTGQFRPEGNDATDVTEWCDDGVLRVVRRRSLARLRREVEPVDPEAFVRFLPGWQGVAHPRRGMDALVAAIEQLQGLAIPAAILERDVLAARVADYRSAMLDELCAAGEVVWTGAGALNDSGRVRLYFRDRLRLLAPAVVSPPDSLDGLHERVRAALAGGGSFWYDLLAATDNPSETELLSALWDLVWWGEVTNDTFAPVRASRRSPRKGSVRRPDVGRLSRLGPPAGAGRWSLVAPALEPRPAATEWAHATALTTLERHGVVTREAVNAEGIPGGFSSLYPVLRALEDAGKVRRGWFVAELGAAQFASTGAIERLRSYREPEPEAAALLLAAADPAQPFGAVLPWPEHSGGRPTRTVGAHVVLVDGRLAAYLDRSHGVLTFAAGGDDPERWIEAIAEAQRRDRLGSLEWQTIDGAPAREAGVAEALRDAGFKDSYRGLVLRD